MLEFLVLVRLAIHCLVSNCVYIRPSHKIMVVNSTNFVNCFWVERWKRMTLSLSMKKPLYLQLVKLFYSIISQLESKDENILCITWQCDTVTIIEVHHSLHCEKHPHTTNNYTYCIHWTDMSIYVFHPSTNFILIQPTTIHNASLARKQFQVLHDQTKREHNPENIVCI